MAINIETLGVTIPGNVTRKRDDDKDSTTFVLNKDQARALYGELGPVLEFFDSQNASAEGAITAELTAVTGGGGNTADSVGGGGTAATIGGLGHVDKAKVGSTKD